MDAANPTTGLSPQPDPKQDRPGKPVPQGIADVLTIVHILLAYGRHLMETLEHRAVARGFSVIAQFFGTARVPAILARLSRGILRAQALERVLLARAARGRDLIYLQPRTHAAREAQPPLPQPPPSHAEPQPPRPAPVRRPDPDEPPIPPICPPWSSSKQKSAAARSAERLPISAGTSASRPACARAASGTLCFP